MCGICGVVSFDGAPELDVVLRMMTRMAHRGPDGSGYLRDRSAVLGHVRLAIIDTEGGAQPLCNEDGTLWVSFNGEIFNYLELRRELEMSGHVFRTRSDTEVIVHAWEQWGPASFKRFNGQWAIALWDCARDQLVLSRDRLGVRPLFYTEDAGRLLFASEAKALFVDGRVSRAIDPIGLEQVLTFWSTVAPRTVFAGIWQLQPGHYAVFDASGLRLRRYWAPSFPSHGQEVDPGVEENARRLRHHLIEASRLRFQRSDVPVGAYLSGGIDSSITAAVVSRYTEAPLRTFSLRFSDAEFDEGPYQREMVARLRAEHREVLVSPYEISAVFPEVVWHAEAPLLRSAPAPMMLLSRLVRDEGYKVVVTGEGADEVLAGYDIFREARVRQFLARDPRSRKRARATELLYPWMARSPGRFPSFARGFFSRNLDPRDPAISHRPRWDTTAALQQMLSAEARADMTGDAAADLLQLMPMESSAWDALSRAQWLEMTTLLPGYILASQGDRMLMANSVEGRFPYLDPELVAFANQAPAWQKLFGLDEKHILKHAFADLLPPQIRARDKQPYRAPDAVSFRPSSAPPWVAEMISRDSVRAAGVFEPALVEGLFAKCERTCGRLGNTDNMRLMAVISTQLLHRQFVEEGGWDGAAVEPPGPMVGIDLVAQDGKQHE